MSMVETIPGAVYAVEAQGAIQVINPAGVVVYEGENALSFPAVHASYEITPDSAAVKEVFKGALLSAGGGKGAAVSDEERAAWNDTVSRINSSAPRVGTGKVGTFSASFGAGADASGYSAVALGIYSHATGRDSFAVLGGSWATGESSLSIGATTEATKKHSTALGCGAKSKDPGVMAFASWNDDATIQTTLYLIGAGSSLATKYENGEACLGYVTKNTDGTIVAAGTRKLSELLTNNTTFAPAALDLDADPPKVFLPTGATDPIEEIPEDEFLTNEQND